MNIRNIPDPSIDWDNFNYNSYSDYNRPEPGFKRCPRCLSLKAVNSWNFSKCKSSADGYQTVCKECAKKQQAIYRQSKKGRTPPTS